MTAETLHTERLQGMPNPALMRLGNGREFEMQDYEKAAQQFAIEITAAKLDVQCVFVPFSQSRNKAEKSPSLNWLCTVTRDGRPIAGLDSVEYMQGIGHAPSHKFAPKFSDGRLDKATQREAESIESETGKIAKHRGVMGGLAYASIKAIDAPKADDVLQSLFRDADAIDYPEFEQWADDCGFDSDSRTGEAIYRQCLKIALALRASVGEKAFVSLRALAGEM